jgi:hypothetical protein
MIRSLSVYVVNPASPILAGGVPKAVEIVVAFG